MYNLCADESASSGPACAIRLGQEPAIFAGHHLRSANIMSALPPKADMCIAPSDVC